jgi:hypothetical protein
MTATQIALFFSAVGAPLAAQWLNHPTPGIPRSPNGKPNPSAPAPRTPYGKPDLSGVWGMDGAKYLGNIAADLRPDDVQPWANAVFQQRALDLSKDDPSDIDCLPQGPRANLYPFPEKIVQTPDLILVLNEELSYRQIFLDGRELPKDPNPSFMGYSVGHWEGDTLVVESEGFNDRLWLDLGGHPHTEVMRITERITRTDFGHLRVDETIDDTKAFKSPFTIHIAGNYLADTDLIEYVCAENERDRQHLVGKATDDKRAPVKIAPAVLARYVGTYDFRFPENPDAPILAHVTLAGGELSLDFIGLKGPLTPLSEAAFSIGGQTVTFMIDDRGAVTHFTMQFAEGDLKAVRLQEGK